MKEIIKELEQIGKELFNKYGTDCYTTRCRLHDAREKLKALSVGDVVKPSCDNLEIGLGDKNCLHCGVHISEHKEY